VAAQGARYIRSTDDYVAGTGYPRELYISHTEVGKGAALRDRHLVRMESPVLVDGVEDGRKNAVYLVADCYRNAFTWVLHERLLKQFYGLLIGGSAQVSSTDAFDLEAFSKRFMYGES
jgi:hypothetical protein